MNNKTIRRMRLQGWTHKKHKEIRNKIKKITEKEISEQYRGVEKELSRLVHIQKIDGANPSIPTNMTTTTKQKYIIKGNCKECLKKDTWILVESKVCEDCNFKKQLNATKA